MDKVLIFVPVDNIVINDYSGYDTWYNYYNGKPETVKNGIGSSKYYSTINKHKWPTIIDIISLYRHIIEKYEYVYLIDNDVKFARSDLDYFIKEVTPKKVQIVQMALARMNGTHPHLLYRGRKGLIRVKFCEVMAPLIRVDVLLEMYDKGYLSESESGWGIDYIWGKFYDNWLVQDCVMYHTKKVSSTQWVMSDGRTPMMELEAIKRKYKIR